MSVCYMNLYDFEAAEDAINSAMEISDESLYHNQLAMIFEREGDFETAVNVLKEAIDLFGKDYILNYNLATIEFNSGDFESATKNFEIAYEIKPSAELKNLIEYVKGEKFKGELN